jgi:hypothetical protein
MLSAKLPQALSTHAKALNYIQREWLPISNMWANFGRQFFHEDQETNNMIER